MTIANIRCELVCDRCGVQVSMRPPNMPAIRQQARRDGWNCDTSRDYCVNCVARMAARKAEKP